MCGLCRTFDDMGAFERRADKTSAGQGSTRTESRRRARTSCDAGPLDRGSVSGTAFTWLAVGSSTAVRWRPGSSIATGSSLYPRRWSKGPKLMWWSLSGDCCRRDRKQVRQQPRQQRRPEPTTEHSIVERADAEGCSGRFLSNSWWLLDCRNQPDVPTKVPPNAIFAG